MKGKIDTRSMFADKEQIGIKPKTSTHERILEKYQIDVSAGEPIRMTLDECSK